MTKQTTILLLLLSLLACACKRPVKDPALPAIDAHYASVDFTTNTDQAVGLTHLPLLEHGADLNSWYIRLNLVGNGSFSLVSKDCGIDFYNQNYSKSVLLQASQLMGTSKASKPCQFRFTVVPTELDSGMYGIVTIPVLPENTDILEFTTNDGRLHKGIVSIKKIEHPNSKASSQATRGFHNESIDFSLDSSDFQRSPTEITFETLSNQGTIEFRSSKDTKNKWTINYSKAQSYTVSLEQIAQVTNLSYKDSDTFIITDTPFDFGLKPRVAYVVLELSKVQALVIPRPSIYIKKKTGFGSDKLCVKNSSKRVAYTLINNKAEIHTTQKATCVKYKRDKMYTINQISMGGYNVKCFYRNIFLGCIY